MLVIVTLHCLHIISHDIMMVAITTPYILRQSF